MGILVNARHEHFAHQVAKGEDATAAYIAAGYSKNGAQPSAARLLSKAMVSARVEEIKENIAKIATEKTAITKAWVLDQLVEIVAMAKAAEPVLDSDGNPIGEYKQNLAAGNKALELIGKEKGMFVERKEIRTGPLEELRDESLDNIIAKKAKELGLTLH